MVYINGATAVPLVKRIRPPKMTIVIRIGSNHIFLRTFRKSHNSDKKDITNQNCCFMDSGLGPGGSRWIQYDFASGSSSRRSGSLPRIRNVKAVGVTVKKKIIPIVSGFTTRCSSRPNFIHRKLNLANIDGINNAVNSKTPAMPAAHNLMEPVPKSQGHTPINEKTKKNTKPNERLDDPLIVS